MTKLLLLKLGAALAVSAAGYVAAKLRPRRSPPSFTPSEVAGLQAGLDLIALDDGAAACSAAAAAAAAVCGFGNCLEDELCLLRNEEALAQIINGTFNSLSETTNCDSEEEEQSMLPDVDELVSNQVSSIELVPEATETTKIGEERSSMEKEITHLKNMISCLEERERSLEIKLLQYHGLRDQDATLREFENRFKINAVESRLLSIKVETLQAENEQLKSQAAEYSKVSADLEEARTKVELLKRKLRVEGANAKDNIASLQQRIEVLEEDGSGGKNTRDLEEEIASLRMVNSQLAGDNLELGKKLKSRELRGSSVVDVQKTEKLDEVNRLRGVKDQLIKEMEQLQTDRCTDLEELVYLRWINACLRYELRNFQNPNGRALARDLSKSLSPKSEEKAKQLILEYANSGADDRGISLMDFDSDCYSSPSQSSNDEYDDASFATTSTTKNSRSSRSKFLSKFKKIVLGTPASRGNSERRASLSSSASLDFGHRNIPRHFSDTQAASKLLELDAVKRRERRKSDIIMRLNKQNDEDVDVPADLKKFAKALESSDVRRRAASFSFR